MTEKMKRIEILQGMPARKTYPRLAGYEGIFFILTRPPELFMSRGTLIARKDLIRISGKGLSDGAD